MFISSRSGTVCRAPEAPTTMQTSVMYERHTRFTHMFAGCYSFIVFFIPEASLKIETTKYGHEFHGASYTSSLELWYPALGLP
jgi:hypothetical protein